MSGARRQRPLENMAQYYCGVQPLMVGPCGSLFCGRLIPVISSQSSPRFFGEKKKLKKANAHFGNSRGRDRVSVSVAPIFQSVGFEV